MAASDEDIRRYSPARCIGCDLKVVSGNPDPKHVSTSFVERHNLTMHEYATIRAADKWFFKELSAILLNDSKAVN